MDDGGKELPDSKLSLGIKLPWLSSLSLVVLYVHRDGPITSSLACPIFHTALSKVSSIASFGT